ncbi:MAG: hypothetical protein AAGH41_02670 [Pseudomonadota bacterium]
MKRSKKENTLFANGRFIVTESDVRTKNVYYPISETTGRVRKDFLFFALGFAGITGFALWRYFDLWTGPERLTFSIVIAIALLIGTQISVLEVNAKGLASRMFITHSLTARRVFEAIVEARRRQRSWQRKNFYAEGLAECDVELGD